MSQGNQIRNWNRIKYLSLAVAIASAAGCGGSSSGGGGGGVAGTAAYVAKNSELKGDFAENVTLEAGKVYAINGEVNFLEGTTLTIPAGTTLYGKSGSSYLAINRGAQIFANGTAASPIIFTSAQDIAGTAGQNDQGQWGGLTILGQSTNNKGERTYEAGTQLYGPKDGITISDDNSGELEYVLIKHSGFEIEKDKELNGLSLASVGSGTKIENIAVVGSADDAIEFWGGTVNVTNLYIYNAGDDSIDTDEGFTGTIDNAYALQVLVDDEIDSRALEADSYDTTKAFDDTAPLDQQIVSRPVLMNATLDTRGRAIRLREGTGYLFDNVQVNVKTSSADPATMAMADYVKEIAAIRISDQTTFDTAKIEVQGAGLAVVNEAVDLELFTDAAGDIGSDGVITEGKGIYRDQATLDYFRVVAGGVHETVGVTQSMIDSGFRDYDGNVFAATVAADNTVTGADMSAFSWVDDALNQAPIVVLSGDITTNTTLSKNNRYAITGEVNVVDGVTLTIPAGTTLFGATGSSYLAINRGARIIADGTAAEPIVFTSAQDIAGLNTTGDEQGQWGGLTILGQSTNNKGERTYEAGTQKYGPDAGVTIAADDSGTLRYVVIKYSGFEVEKDKELNGLSLASVGSGTIMENIAVIGSADDGVEFWGGTVNINGLYIYNAADDSIDTDQGFTGKLENVYVQQNVVDDEIDSRILEADGYDATKAFDDTLPADQQIISKPHLKNAMLKGTGRLARLREGTGYIFENVQMITESSTDPNAAAIRISDQPTFDVAQIETVAPGLAIKNLVTAGAIFHDAATETYFNGLSNVLEDDDSTLIIPEYDSSWVPN